MNETEETPLGICCTWRGPLGLSKSNNEKYWTPFKEFHIAEHYPPGAFNQLDICRVTNTAIKWFLNYVEDSFMIQQVRIPPELKSC